jgi:hypothetical protein
MASGKEKMPATSSGAEVAEFLQKVAASPAPKPAGKRGRLMFAMDATASREPTWDRACHIQGEMFQETAALGGLDVQLVHYRGFHEIETSPWLSDSPTLLRRMTAVTCLGGHTQIARVLRHAMAESRRQKVDALVFVGDCMEEDVDQLCHLAGELGVLGVPVFLFQEGDDAVAARTFKQIARLTRGVYCHFDAGSARHLRDLLSAVAVYAAGGRRALEDFGQRRGGLVPQLTHRLGR